MKKNLKYVLVALISIPALAMAESTCKCRDIPEGFHEWSAFGERSVFLSHSPMFGSIHSYQVIVEATLRVDGKDKSAEFFASEKANPNASFTISPTSPTDRSPAYWVLPENMKEGASFDARLHFQDTAGKDIEIFPVVKVGIKKIWVNRMFRSDNPRPEKLTYFYFGNSDETYLANAMTWDPDFDQIVKVSTDSIPSRCSPVAEKLSFSSRSNEEINRIQPGDSLTGVSECPGPNIQVKALRDVFEYKISIQR